MNQKTYNKLELNKILAQLAEYAAFSASRAILENLQPTPDLEEAQYRQQETTEARALLEDYPNTTVGGARDIRPHIGHAERGITLNPSQLLEIRATLESAGRLKKTLVKSGRFPILAEIAQGISEGKYLIAAIDRAIDDQGLVKDSASAKLSEIRRGLRRANDRLHSRLQSIVASSQYSAYLQESLVTTRSGRYVIPIKAEYRGRVKGIVHDQSSSGATLFIEPVETVEINNEIRELELAEEDEIHRILSEITGLVGEDADQIVWTVEALAALDAAFAKAKYATVLRAAPPVLTGFDETKMPGSTIQLYGARHPLLDPDTVVPIDVILNDENYVLIITGPNTGGKTVSLKTTGLMILMAQCGLHLPAEEGTTLTVFEKVFADIGDEQSIEQSLSTFSAHLTHIIDILDGADDRSLVLLDELGSGTDPTEGAAIARAILNDLLQRGITTFVATHYPELKLYAHSTPGVRNASVEFDVKTLSPTYRLIIGLPGRSNALAIATRLGLPQYVIDEAQSYVGEADLNADDLLDEIHRTRDEIRQTQVRLHQSETETAALQEELKDRLANIEAEREAIIGQTRSEAEAELQVLHEEIRELQRRFKTLSPTQKMSVDFSIDDLETLAQDAASLGELVDTPVKKAVSPPPPPRQAEPEPIPQGELQPGDHVFVTSLNAEGEVVSIGGGDQIEVQVGNLRVRVDADNLERRAGRLKPQPEVGLSGYADGPRPESPGIELNLRGFLVEDALPALEAYLDQAYLAGLPWVRIIHGHGTGALKKAVRDEVRKHPLVKEHKRAPQNEGGDGVTIVRFKPLS